MRQLDRTCSRIASSSSTADPLRIPRSISRTPLLLFVQGKKKNMYILLFIQVFIFLFVIIESLYLNGRGSRHVFTKATACSLPLLLELLCLLRIHCNGFLIITNSEGWKDITHQMHFFSLGKKTKKQPTQTRRAEIKTTFVVAGEFVLEHLNANGGELLCWTHVK